MMTFDVPKFPEKLPGELWGIIAIFNPAGYKNKFRNLEFVVERLRSQGVKLLIVELAFNDADFEIPEGFCDRVERRRTKGVLWQKERLLNIGLKRLPPSCDKVAWLDGDVILENDEWVAETARLLETYIVVQPFDTACWLPEGMREGPDQSFFGFGNHEKQSMAGMGYAMSRAREKREALESYFKHGHTGFAWAARRSLLDKHGFYDCQILGNADFVIGHAMYGNVDFWEGRNWQCLRLSEQLQSHIKEWSEELYEDVRDSVYYVPGRCLHLWHGDQTDRQYDERLLVLKECQFDPEKDLVLDENDCWMWNSDKPTLHQWAADYFRARKEE